MPAAFIAVLLYGGYKALRWLADHVATPVVTSHVTFLETQVRMAEDHAEQSTRMEQAIQEQAKYQQRQGRCLEKLSDLTIEVHRKVHE